MDFPYSSLRSNELRLLTPLPRYNNRDLHFKISTVSQVIAPLYTAVSYTWGDGDRSELIYLNGRVFRVRPNLWSCLHYLSLHARHAVWKHMWVDAICIDQSNNLERGAQVRFMDQIYSNAASVSVWLGLAPHPEPSMTFSPSYNRPEPILTIDYEDLDWAESIVDLANRPYWSRFWVIQEFLLGRNVELFCSGHCVDWQPFKEILCHATGINENSSVYRGTSNDNAVSLGALPLVMGRHPDRHPEFFQPLHELLINHRRSKCKDLRDRVFALLGLVPSEERTFLDRFFPDYTLSEENVVIITLAHVVQLNRESITPDSEELFLGLGVESKVQRRRLLERANSFDYIDMMLGQFVEDMAFQDLLDSSGDVDMEGSYEVGMTEASFFSTGRRVVVFLILALSVGAFVWWKWCEQNANMTVCGPKWS
jgi:Heterokaryon incompatibility protein (HET)